jgi:predicted DsbA family dithiol-disulfide isomerase
MHDALFQNQQQWNQLPDPSEYLAKVAQQAGAEKAAYDRCIQSGQAEAQVQKSVEAAAALGFNGTPTFRFILNKTGQAYTLSGAYPVDTYHQWTDQLLAGKAPTQDQPEQSGRAAAVGQSQGPGPRPQPPGLHHGRGSLQGQSTGASSRS